MIVDLFAGMGGWSEGLRTLGLRSVGLEMDEWACRSRIAAGHATIRCDISSYMIPKPHWVYGLVASPPCQDFSVAGKRAGRTGDRGRLVDIVPDWVEALRPEWFACEQVPPVLPIWREHAELYRLMGYSVWCGVLNAANYGVPQTRQRAILLASRVRPALPPEPTHAAVPVEGLFGSRLPWVTMADALGWGMTERPSTTLAPGAQTGGSSGCAGGSGARKTLTSAMERGAWAVQTNNQTSTGGLYQRPTDEPAPTVTSRTDLWSVDRRMDSGDAPPVTMDRPAPSFTTKSGGQWVFTRPSTTVCGDPRVAFPGHHDEDARSMSEEHGAVKLTVREALTLQSFRPDFPVQGTKTRQFLQVGNAVPPRLVAHLVSSLTGAQMEEAA